MKLLLYSHFFAPSIGGVETLVLSLARGLAALRNSAGTLKFAVTLVTETPAADFDDAALPFRVVRRPGKLTLSRLLRDTDVVHVAGPAFGPLALGLLLRKPVVVEHHGFQTICPNGQLLIEPSGIPCPGHFMARRHGECFRCNAGQGRLASRKLWLMTFVRRFLCRRVAANITPTAWLAGLLGLPQAVAIPHGLETIAPLVPIPEQPQRPLIAFQGRLVTTKGVGVLFDAARILSEQGYAFELLVIGEGPERAALEQRAQQDLLAGKVRFTGRLAGKQLAAALAKSSVVVVPSLGGEVFGLVVAENMARGLPVIASDLGAFVEVVGDAGLTFRTGDAAELARELAGVLDDPAFSAQLRHHARQRALEFCDYQRMLDAHASVYEQALHPPVRAGR